MDNKDFLALKELALLINQNHGRRVPEITKSASVGMRNLYQGLIDEQFSSDEEAASLVLSRGKQSSGYQKLKSKLYRRLLNAAVAADWASTVQNDRQRAYYEVHKDWATAKILLGKNAHLAGIQLCHRVLNKARRFEFSDMVLDIARTLRLHYGATVGDSRKFHQFNDLYKEYLQIILDENQAEEWYIELISGFVNSKTREMSVREEARKYDERVTLLVKRSDTYRTRLCAYLIRLIIFTSVNDYEGTIRVCDDGIRYFEKKSYTASRPLQILYYQLLVCHIQLKRYQEGKISAEKCLSLLEEGSFNWFKYQELYFILCMHTRQYQEAYQIFVKTVEHRKFTFLPQSAAEIWKIYEAYLHYLVNLELIEANEDQRFSKFRLGRFLNETPLYSKDKRGMNIPILVIQILLMIRQRKYSEAIDRIEAIKKYCSRYLRKNDTFRSNCFIKMLVQVPASNFHKAGVTRRAEKYLQKLKAFPLNIANQTHEIEIIPYEDLWEMAISSLDHNFH